MTYDSPQALRTALEHRLLITSREAGVTLDRLRRRVLFERIVARLQVAEPGLWVLKGGMALEVRLSDAARLTKDIDVGLRDSVAGPADLHERLIVAVSDDPFKDRFIFEVSEPTALHEDGGGHLTWRVPIAAFLAGKQFGAIKLDVSPRAHELQATDRLPLPNSLDFAGIPTTEVEIVDVHRHAAEKFHAMTRDFGDRENSRVQAQAESCLEAIESFLVRRYLVDVPTNVLNRLFTTAIGNLPQGEPIDTALRRELSRDKRWPDDDRVRDGVANVHYYFNGRPYQQRLVLQRLESYLRAEIDLDFDSAKLSIEHVMPQTLSDGWKNQLEDAGHDPREVFDRLGHTLGNLTLTAWNSKLSNQLFERKQEILQDSDLKLNEHLASALHWGAEEIQKRSQLLADAANELWSAPIPGVVTARSGFDWSRVDDAVAALPAGWWTSYGDLAELAGTAAQPTANHIAHDPAVTNAYRVLSSDGSISFKFQWHDPADTRDPMQMLIGEGIDFDEDDKASQAQRLGPPELEALLDSASTDAP